MSGSPGYQGKIQIDKGQTASFTEVGGVITAPPDVSKDELDTTTLGNKAYAKIQGLADGSSTIECILDTSDPGQQDLLDAWEDGALIDVEQSPNAREGSNVIAVAYTVRVFNVSFSTDVSDRNTVSFDIMNADGNAPAFEIALT